MFSILLIIVQILSQAEECDHWLESGSIFKHIEGLIEEGLIHDGNIDDLILGDAQAESVDELIQFELAKQGFMSGSVSDDFIKGLVKDKACQPRPSQSSTCISAGRTTQFKPILPGPFHSASVMYPENHVGFRQAIEVPYFEMADTPVTEFVYTKIMGHKPPYSQAPGIRIKVPVEFYDGQSKLIKMSPDSPAKNISLEDVKSFITKLNTLASDPNYSIWLEDLFGERANEYVYFIPNQIQWGRSLIGDYSWDRSHPWVESVGAIRASVFGTHKEVGEVKGPFGVYDQVGRIEELVQFEDDIHDIERPKIQELLSGKHILTMGESLRDILDMSAHPNGYPANASIHFPTVRIYDTDKALPKQWVFRLARVPLRQKRIEPRYYTSTDAHNAYVESNAQRIKLIPARHNSDLLFSETMITQWQFAKIIGSNPSLKHNHTSRAKGEVQYLKNCKTGKICRLIPNSAALGVSLHAALRFIKNLNDLSQNLDYHSFLEDFIVGYQPFMEFRLPTRQEWLEVFLAGEKLRTHPVLTNPLRYGTLSENGFFLSPMQTKRKDRWQGLYDQIGLGTEWSEGLWKGFKVYYRMGFGADYNRNQIIAVSDSEKSLYSKPMAFQFVSKPYDGFRILGIPAK